MVDSTEVTKNRLKEIDKEIAELKEQYSTLLNKWQNEKSLIQRIRDIKQEIEEYRFQADEYERQGDFGKVAEIRYGKLIELDKELKETNAKLEELQKQGKILKEEVEAEDIAEIVSKWTGIPLQKMLETERTKLLKIEERIHNRLVDQEEAVSTVANAIRRSRAGLQDPNRPIGSFIFLGSTGVGKTELARALAEFLFDDENAMVRIDMSEYMEKHSVSRLIGAPPGYVGYEEGGQLTEAIRQRPYSVVLLDEIEKAHPEVFNVLLQLLDDGRMTDGKGRIVNFKNTIVIMTSNLGAEILQDRIHDINESNREKIMAEIKEQLIELLKRKLKPEFLNRVDEILVFKPLLKSEVIEIAKLQLRNLTEKLKKNEIDIEFSEKALNRLTDLGYDVQYGARPLKRAVQKYIADPLAIEILSTKIQSGDKVLIDLENDNFVFKKIN